MMVRKDSFPLEQDPTKNLNFCSGRTVSQTETKLHVDRTKCVIKVGKSVFNRYHKIISLVHLFHSPK